MPIQVVFSGNAKSAKRAAARAGFAVSKCTKNPKFAEVYCQASCGSLTKVQAVFGSRTTIKRGRGYPPGTVTFFSIRDCKTSELHGIKPKCHQGKK